MDTLAQIEVLFRQLPLETVVRHEAGHAVMAHCCGGFVKRVVFGRNISGENYGRSFWAVRPYFDQAVGLLANARDRLDGLTEILLAQPPGLGPRSLKRFFAGHRRSRLAEWIDRPRVVWAAYAERCSSDT